MERISMIFACGECGNYELQCVAVRPLQDRISAPAREGKRRCLACAWREAMPAEQDLLIYLNNVLFYAARAGWDVIAWHDQPCLVDLIARVNHEQIQEAA